MHKINGLDLTGKTSYVYFMMVGDNGPIKIGFTKNIRHRLSVVQVDNPFLVTLLSVMPGGRAEEFELHKRFSEYRLYGEWFVPSEDVIEFVNSLDHLGLVLFDFQRPRMRGDKCHNWKGDKASASSKRQRARAYTRWKKQCDRCKKSKGLDIVFIDGNKDNLSEDNVALFCRRCRMETDGTLDNLVKSVYDRYQKNKINSLAVKELKELNRKEKELIGSQNDCAAKELAKIKKEKYSKEQQLIKESVLKKCLVCNYYKTTLRKGRCHACNEFFRRNGFERSEKPEKREHTCSVCGLISNYIAKEKCHACYEYYYRNGFDRTFYLQRDEYTNEIKQLQNMPKNTMDKAKVIRKLYASNKYSAKFLAKYAGISVSYLNDIIRNRYFIENNYTYTSNRKRH